MKYTNANNTANLSTNQRVGYWNEQKINERQNALKVAEQAKTLEHLQNKPIKYDLKR